MHYFGLTCMTSMLLWWSSLRRWHMQTDAGAQGQFRLRTDTAGSRGPQAPLRLPLAA